MREYNKLTQRLLAEGYTAENHPEWVRVSTSQFGDGNPLHNLNGGFVYYWDKMPEKIFKTPCGLYVKREHTHSSMSWKDEEWTWENDLATIHCPFDKIGCELNHPKLRDERSPAELPLCAVSMTDEEYSEENSYEHYDAIAEWWQNELLEDFKKKKHDRYCLMHMRYSREKEEWSMWKYDPSICKDMRCTGTCQYLGIPIDIKRGNVFYDLRITRTMGDERGTLFEGSLHTSIRKGIKVFRKPTSMTICENYAKLCKKDIECVVSGNLHFDKFMEELRGGTFEYQVENVRAQRKETRDIWQDLSDIKQGIKVLHDSDTAKQSAQKKREEKEKRTEQKKHRLRKKMIEGRELSYSEERQTQKLFSDYERLEIEVAKELKEKELKAEQLSIFDFLGGDKP